MKAAFFLVALVFSSLVFAQDITMDKINGTWKVIDEMAEKEDLGDDLWIFESGKYRVVSSGKSVGLPDNFRIEGSTIFFGKAPWEGKISVLALTKDKMKVNTYGIIQYLERVK